MEGIIIAAEREAVEMLDCRFAIIRGVFRFSHCPMDFWCRTNGMILGGFCVLLLSIFNSLNFFFLHRSRVQVGSLAER